MANNTKSKFKKKIKKNPDQEYKHDEGKVELNLVENDFLRGIAKVRMLGNVKYEPNSWKKVPDLKKKYINAARRHILEYLDGDIYDEESGEEVLLHAACCLMFVHWAENNLEDDNED
jgi:hypothetical protein